MMATIYMFNRDQVLGAIKRGEIPELEFSVRGDGAISLLLQDKQYFLYTPDTEGLTSIIPKGYNGQEHYPVEALIWKYVGAGQAPGQTDLEKWKAFLTSQGLPPEEKINELGNTDLYLRADSKHGERSAAPKITGYGGFLARIEFDKDGKFIRFGVWE